MNEGENISVLNVTILLPSYYCIYPLLINKKIEKI